VRGGLLTQLNQVEAAREAFGRAMALAGTPIEAAHIRSHIDRLGTPTPTPPLAALK
jgi:RNA polymerase sigma-70 factor (ECF subfamily)